MFLILVVLLFTITFNACSDSEHSSYINISSDEIEANYKSEEYSINIESNCEWQILTDAQWIDVKDMLSGSGNQKLTFSIKANTEYDERESYLTINSLDGTTSASKEPLYMASPFKSSLSPFIPKSSILYDRFNSSQLLTNSAFSKFPVKTTE